MDIRGEKTKTPISSWVFYEGSLGVPKGALNAHLVREGHHIGSVIGLSMKETLRVYPSFTTAPWGHVVG